MRRRRPARARRYAAARCRSGCAARRTSSPRPWWRPCLARPAAGSYDVPAHPRRRGRPRPARAARRPGQPTASRPGELVLDPTNVERASVDEINVHAGSSRIPILFCGPLLHRIGHAFIPDLGGCHIGDRPIDFHLQALREFGAIVDKTPQGLHHHRAERAARHQVRAARTRASAPPSRCCSPRCWPRA